MLMQVREPKNVIYGRDDRDYEGRRLEDYREFEDYRAGEDNGEDDGTVLGVPNSNGVSGRGMRMDLPTSMLQSMGVWTQEAQAAFRLGLRAAHTPGGLTGTPAVPAMTVPLATLNYLPKIQTPTHAGYRYNTAQCTPYALASAGHPVAQSVVVGNFGVASQQPASRHNGTTSIRDSKLPILPAGVDSLRAQSTPTAGPSKRSQSQDAEATRHEPALLYHEYERVRRAEEQYSETQTKIIEVLRQL